MRVLVFSLLLDLRWWWLHFLPPLLCNRFLYYRPGRVLARPESLKELSMAERADGGEAILEAFRSLDIDYVISSPGSEWPSVWEALARQQIAGTAGPKYLNCGHETLAVAMAAGYTQYTGRMQAVLLHAGLGVLQGAMPIAGAYNGEIPMLIASGESTAHGARADFDPGAQWYRGLGVVGGPGRWVAPFTKWSGRVTSPETIYETVTRAGELAQRVPKGPTFLSVPMEVMIDPWEARSHAIPAAPKVLPDPNVIGQVAALITNASNPVILTETAGKHPEGFNALIRLAEAAAIPVVEALTALYGNFPKDHPLYLGYDFAPFLDDADLVLLISNRVPWYPPGDGPKKATVVVIDDNPIKVQLEYQNLQADLYLEGDTTAALTMLADSLPQPGPETAVRGISIEAMHDEQRADIRKAFEASQGTSQMTATFVAGTIADAVGDDAIIIDETIVHRLAILRNGRWNRSQSYFRSSGGLGRGIGQALGIKLAGPERPVVMCIGDGSLLYNPLLPSVGAAFEHDLPILIIVFNNASYASMKGMHLKFYPEGISAETGVHVGISIPGPDYAAVMAALGGHGERVESPDRLQPAIAEALKHVEDGRPALLDVIVPD